MYGAAWEQQKRLQRVWYSGLSGLSKLGPKRRDLDRGLQLSPANEEFLVNASQQLALITSLQFVRTTRC